VTRESYDPPDFRALGDGPYPPILLEAVEGAGDRFERWNEQVEHTGYCCRPIRLSGKVEHMDRATGKSGGVYTTDGEPDDVLLVACGSGGLRGAAPAPAGTCGMRST
jgi:hypothetical protein